MDTATILILAAVATLVLLIAFVVIQAIICAIFGWEPIIGWPTGIVTSAIHFVATLVTGVCIWLAALLEPVIEHSIQVLAAGILSGIVNTILERLF